MGRSISAKLTNAASGAPLISLKWRVHNHARTFPAMTMTLTADVAKELRDALSEAIDQINAAPSAKVESRDGQRRT